MQQLSLFDYEKKSRGNGSTTFISNMSLPIHRWYRFSAGYSAEWAENVIKRNLRSSNSVVLDPFAGSGTTLLACDKLRVQSIGFEAQPFIYKVAKVKTNWNINTNKLVMVAKKILMESKEKYKQEKLDEYPSIVIRSYTRDNLLKLQTLVKETKKYSREVSTELTDMLFFIITAILRKASGVGTAQWQYILPNKKTKSQDPFVAYSKKLSEIVEDIRLYQTLGLVPKSKLIYGSSKNMSCVAPNSVDLVITSPPYANNYDYADTTRLEMSFYHEISGWGDLQSKVRKNLIHSSTQSVTKIKDKTYDLIEDKILIAIHDELKEKCKQLEIERENHGGKKNYYAMIAAYFFDIAQVLKELRRVLKSGGRMCWVIGDSAPYGVYIPVDEWIGRIAISLGFKSFNFEKVRDRNIKWKNRTHRVPLKEGYLWIEG